ncbi:MAG TPA: ACP S-malonyltransferase, partial [Firmicutes bacterium]|nr:ACP S-malonyltransferase [Bacillota bacterium]
QFGSRIKDACFVGHSLGEITALAAAGAFSFADGVRLTAKRGELMENAAANGGGMAAVIGLDSEKVARLCRVVAEHDWVQVANENSPDQVVVSGRAAGLEKIARLAKEQGARAVIPLNVAGPFHSKLMNEAALQFEEFLEEIEFKRTDAPVLSGDGVSFLGDDPDKIRLRLAAQITAPVRFKDCVETLWAANVREFIEVGPQPLLINLGRRTQPALKFLLVTEEGI